MTQNIRLARRSSIPPLIDSTPLAALLHGYQLQADAMRNWPTSRDAVATLDRVIAELSRAIDDASDTDVFVRLADASRLAGQPVSTLRRRCDSLGSKIGATKRGKSWMIHWPTFQQYITHNLINEEAA